MAGQRFEQPEEVNQTRYDRETLRKVTTLAQRLQNRAQETMTAGEMEAILAEVGLRPTFIHEALAKLTKSSAATTRKPTLPTERMKALATTWWAAAWTLPIVLLMSTEHTIEKGLSTALFFLALGIYIGGGIWLSNLAKASREEALPGLSRTALLEMLFALQQQQAEEQKQHRAFLSLEVVDSTERKLDAAEPSVEHSFGQFRAWVGEAVLACGGEVHSASEDGMLCVFADEGAALRAARRLLEGLPQFNAETDGLAAPFRLRCGISAGEVALESGTALGSGPNAVIDRAAALRQRAEPDEVVFGNEVAPAALKELDRLEALHEPVAGDRAFFWRADPAAEGSP
jgi:class 3 adenylate cyclase